MVTACRNYMCVGFKWTSDCRNDVFKWNSDCRNGLRIAEMIVIHNFRMFESSAAAEAKHVWICASEWLRLTGTICVLVLNGLRITEVMCLTGLRIAEMDFGLPK